MIIEYFKASKINWMQMEVRNHTTDRQTSHECHIRKTWSLLYRFEKTLLESPPQHIHAHVSRAEHIVVVDDGCYLGK